MMHQAKGPPQTATCVSVGWCTAPTARRQATWRPPPPPPDPWDCPRSLVSMGLTCCKGTTNVNKGHIQAPAFHSILVPVLIAREGRDAV